MTGGLLVFLADLNGLFQLGRLLVGAEELEAHTQKKENGNDQPKNIPSAHLAAEEQTELVDDEGNGVGETTLVSDGKRGPLPVVHLSADGTHSREAGSAEQVKEQEGEAGQRGKDGGDRFAGHLQNRHDLLLGHKTHEGSHGGGGLREAQGGKDPTDGRAYVIQDALAALGHIGQVAEAAVARAEHGARPDDDGGEHDDGAGLLDEGPASLPHGPQDVADGGEMVGRELHDEGSGGAGEELGLLEHDARHDDGGDAHEVAEGSHPPGIAEEGSGDHGDDGKLGTAGDEGGGDDGHAAIPLVLNGTGCHDTGYAAARTDQNRDKGLTRQTELAEDAIQHKGDTGHITAGLQEGQEQEQHKDLGNEAQHGAHTGHDAVQHQTVQPIGGIQSRQTPLHQYGDTGHPQPAVVGGIGLARSERTVDLKGTDHVVAVLVGVTEEVIGGDVRRSEGFRVLIGPQVGVILAVLVHVYVGVGGMLSKDISGGGLGGGNVALLHRGRVSGYVNPLFLGACHELANQGPSICLLAVLVRANTEQMPAVPEYAVVGEISYEGAHGGYRDVVHEEHDGGENGQSRHAMGDYLIDLFRDRELTHVLALEAPLQYGGYVVVTLVDDDGLGVVVQQLLRLLDVLLNVGEDSGIQLQLGQYLFIPLEDLDGVPSLAVGGHAVYGGLLDVGEGMLHLTREDVVGNIPSVLGGFNGQLDSLLQARALECRDLHGGATHAVGQLLQIDLVSLLAENVHHVDGHDHGNAQLGQLGGEVEVALQVGAVDDVQDGIGAFHHQIVSGHYLLQGVGGKGIDAGQVGDDDGFISVMVFELALLLFHRDAGPVAYELVGAGQGVEQGGFARVGISRQGNADGVCFHVGFTPCYA